MNHSNICLLVFPINGRSNINIYLSIIPVCYDTVKVYVKEPPNLITYNSFLLKDHTLLKTIVGLMRSVTLPIVDESKD